MQLSIRPATIEDADGIWDIIRQVISTGETYVFEPKSSKEEMLDYWFDTDQRAYVATSRNEIVGTFVIKDNQPGLGSHVANASFMTHPWFEGKGAGRAMAEYSLIAARRLGYKAMQFNIVVKSNQRAVNLWLKVGFKIIGEIPEAFNHSKLGLTSAYIMYQKL